MLSDKIKLYILYDPTFVSKKFYIGYSNNPQHRLRNHINVKEENSFKDNWINKLAQRDIEPIPFIVASFPNEILAGEAEKQLITFCRATGIKLTNILDGGNKPPYKAGEDSTNAKLTWQETEEIRNKYFQKRVSKTKLAKEYNVSKGLIRKIVHYESWINKNTVVPENLEQLLQEREKYGRISSYENHSGINNGHSKLDEIDVLKIRKLFATGEYTKRQLAQIFNITPTNAGLIIKRKTWIHI